MVLTKNQAITEAKQILSQNFLAFDIETTGLKPLDRVGIVQVGFVNPKERTVYSAQCDPENCDWGEYPKQLHGIGLSGYFTEREVCQVVSRLLSSFPTIVYNAEFDIGVLRERCKMYDIEFDPPQVYDVMPLYAAFIGEWSTKYGDWKRQKLPNLSLSVAHDAVNDCISTIRVLHRIVGVNTDELLSCS
jgi:DNA polymerase III epsilon subunit-like protein